ncbi:MAG: histidine phosphatase family protein [Patescibacteria group bacterium]|nr:phosphoglycerate mutase family protein [Patescibacteria group bacterium]MDE1944400.1 histidine phosphatase family protein [Patescibacteria group bacterium]MDE1945209.1 histidine phosphatase family protein [Patescibacteria group bacterium]MDE2057804.1 histidine phosphatase family protein [Patescibacteria group bacterium]
MPSAADVVATILASFDSLPIYLLLAASALILLLAWGARPRRVYFVRHGETEANARRIRQAEAGPLSALGRAEVAAAAAHLARFPIQAMVASPFERARETAAILNETLRVPLTFSPLLAERRNPSVVVGRSEDDPAVKQIMDAIDRVYHDDDYRYADEENFLDLKDRAKKLLALLAAESPRHVVAVTHGIFLKMVIGYLIDRENLHAGEYAKLSFFNAADNAGITIVEYEPLKRCNATRGWRVLDYNITPYEDTKPPSAPLNVAPRIPAPIS